MSAAQQEREDVEVQRIEPHPQQQKFLEASEDIVFFGGGAGGGKSRAAVMDPLRWVHLSKFRAIVFRRITSDLEGLWDEAASLYPLFGGVGVISGKLGMRWRFPSGARVKFSHLEDDKALRSHTGQSYAVVIFDEATHYPEKAFWHLLSRLRSLSGVKPYMRCTCNPQSEGWVRELLRWWIDEETGLPIPDRAGRPRFFIRDARRGTLDWADTREEVESRHKGKRALSITFIPSKLDDNPTITANDPDYRDKLEALPAAERAALLDGNWNARESAGDYFQEAWFPPVEAPPYPITRRVRFWDLAASVPTNANPDPDFTEGWLVYEMRPRGATEPLWLIADVIAMRKGPAEVEAAMLSTAHLDGHETEVGFYKDPAQAGKAQASALTAKLAGFTTHTVPATRNVETLAKPVTSLAKVGRIYVLRRPWTRDALRQLEAFPFGGHDDGVSALAGAFQVLTGSVPIRSFRVRGI